MERKHSVLEATVPNEEDAKKKRWFEYLKERAEQGFIDPPSGPNRRQRRGSGRLRMKRNADPNQPCPCGSGKTFGECHLAQAIAAYQENPAVVLSADARREQRNKRKAERQTRRGR